MIAIIEIGRCVRTELRAENAVINTRSPTWRIVFPRASQNLSMSNHRRNHHIINTCARELISRALSCDIDFTRRSQGEAQLRVSFSQLFMQSLLAEKEMTRRDRSARAQEQERIAFDSAINCALSAANGASFAQYPRCRRFSGRNIFI